MATFNTGCGTLHIKNASAVDVGFSVAQPGYVQWVVQAGEPRDIPIPMSKATIYWAEQNKLNTNTKQIQSVVYVESYEKGETIPASQALPRHQNTTNIGYTAFSNWNGNTANETLLSAFNPAKSGVNGTFVLAECSIDASNTLNALLQFAVTTTDPALATPVTANNNVLGGPTSAFNCTTDHNAAMPASTTFREQLLTTGIYDFLKYPLQFLIPPGNGLLLAQGVPSAAGVNQFQCFSWTENSV